MSLRKSLQNKTNLLLHDKDLTFFVLAAALILLIIVFIYQNVFSLEFQGDGWQYAWSFKVFYKSDLFSPLSLKGMRTSLGGAHITFGFLESNFGLAPVIYYTSSVILKFLSVVMFFLLVKKLTNNRFSALISSIILAVTFVGVEATHWVFNMYAYIGLTFIIASLLVGFDLPTNFSWKRWLISFFLACAGVWYATMRTNGIIILILGWSLYKVITLRSKNSIKNLTFWIFGFLIFLLIDKFLLGQMESDYSQQYIIGQGINAFNTLIASHKYDFLLSPATNLGDVIFPYETWSNFNFPSTFSFLGASPLRTIILPSLAVFTVLSWFISSLAIKREKARSSVLSQFLILMSLGFIWTILIFFISKQGQLNFSPWETMVLTLFGGYLLILCIYMVLLKNIPAHLKDLFFFSFIWSFVFLLLPEFQNGGPIFGTYHRYMVTTAPSVPLFVAGLLTLTFISKPSLLNNIFRVIILVIISLMLFSHATSTKSFFDRKAQVHNRQLSGKIWQQFMIIVPNKNEYIEKPPTLYFEAADNKLDQETLFESLYFGFPFRVSLAYGWHMGAITGLYNGQDYKALVSDIKKNPGLLDQFYAIRVENQSLINITNQTRQKIIHDIKS